MRDAFEEPRVEEVDGLRAPARAERARHATRARILARAEPLLAIRRAPISGWDVLVGWARPGLAAAAVGVAILGGALHMSRGEAPGQLAADDLIRSDAVQEGIPSWLVASAEPDDAAIVEAALLAPNPNGGER